MNRRKSVLTQSNSRYRFHKSDRLLGRPGARVRPSSRCADPASAGLPARDLRHGQTGMQDLCPNRTSAQCCWQVAETAGFPNATGGTGTIRRTAGSRRSADDRSLREQFCPIVTRIAAGDELRVEHGFLAVVAQRLTLEIQHGATGSAPARTGRRRYPIPRSVPGARTSRPAAGDAQELERGTEQVSSYAPNACNIESMRGLPCERLPATQEIAACTGSQDACACPVQSTHRRLTRPRPTLRLPAPAPRRARCCPRR